MTWVFFRADTVTDARLYLTNIFQSTGAPGSLKDILNTPAIVADPTHRYLTTCMWGIILVLSVDLLQRWKPDMRWLSERPWWLRWPLYYALIFATLRYGIYGQQQFVYFQF
jgi:hypothetical protein